MKNQILTLLLIAMCLTVHGQKHSLGIYLNGIHNFNFYDRNSLTEETISQPLFPRHEYGIEYFHSIKAKNIGLYFSLKVVSHSVRLKRRYDALSNGQKVRARMGASTAGDDPAIRIGVFGKNNFLRLTSGIAIRNIRITNTNGGFSSLGFDNEIYSPLSKITYQIENKYHFSLFFNLGKRLFGNEKYRVDLNLIGSLGLHNIFQSVSIIEDFTTGETRQIVFNNYGTYLGLGVSYSRLSNDKFQNLFKSRNK